MELPFVGGNGVVKKPKNPGMFLMVSYMFQKYATLACALLAVQKSLT